MSDHDDNGQPTTPGKRRHPTSEPEDEVDNNVNESQLSIDEEFQCAICFDTMTDPYAVIPCLHTFDKDCLTEWWKAHNNCPTCKKKAKSAKAAFQLRAIMQHVHKKKKARTSNSPPPQSGNHEDIFPVRGDDDEDEDNEDNDEDDEYNEDDDEEQMGWAPHFNPGDGLIWPCDACSPGHPSGYTCPNPIPEPTDAEKRAEEIRRGPGATRVGPPIRGEFRTHLPLLQPPDANPGVPYHVQCIACSNYIPKDFPRPIKCGQCSSYRCNNFDPAGCPSLQGFNSRADVKLPFPLSTVDYLASLLPHNISRNPHEVTRFKDFIAAKNLITDEIVNQIFTMKHDQVAEDVNLQEADANWGPDSYFCSVCVQPVISPNIFSWYMKARQQSIEANEDIVVIKPECWYGQECRTQTHNRDHSERYNHIGYNTRNAQV